ncbi:hypothetical protein MNBD_BACTEROID06-1741 [hydrothermal vent metagenome]|uniref:DUF1232 domain-containing protein n=1 Tax=hydrothermal vent metagenome TaxID=652676 RepID=A0A3B0UGT8_9ZZZZ
MAQLKIQENKFFERAKSRASTILGDKQKLNEVLNASKARLSEVNLENSKLSKLGHNLRLFLRMIQAFAKGEYTDAPWKSMVAIVAGVIYFLMPIDLIPDFIPFTGFIDDFTVIMLISNAFNQDIEQFEIWDSAKK